jgi:CubicO group peptidase (beta-lactamase class C family)
MRSRLAATLFALGLATLVLRAQRAPVPGPGAFPPLDRYLDALREQAGIPGMSAIVVQDGEPIWEYASGFQNVGARIRATPDTPYLLGDMSSAIGAVLVLQCIEQRRMDLDEPVTRYGLSFPEPGVTLRHLLSHTSAVQPGESFTYSPDRFAQLATAVEWCAPQPYRKTVAHRILNRLAMIDSVPGTDWQDPQVVPDELFEQSDIDHYRDVLTRMALPYKVDGRGRSERMELPPAGIDASGGLVSTVRDLAKFDKALIPPLLLTEDTLNAAWTPVVSTNGTVLPMGLGWFSQTYRGERVVWHFGYIPNAYSSLMLKLPDRHLTFILLANSDRLSAPFQLASGDVTRSVYASLFLKRATCPLAGSC